MKRTAARVDGGTYGSSNGAHSLWRNGSLPQLLRQVPLRRRLKQLLRECKKAGDHKTDIVVGRASDIVTLDPAGQQDTTSGVLMKHAYSTLLDVDNEGKVVPDLAESYEMKSDTEYVFKLREDACFWDSTR